MKSKKKRGGVLRKITNCLGNWCPNKKKNNNSNKNNKITVSYSKVNKNKPPGQQIMNSLNTAKFLQSSSTQELQEQAARIRKRANQLHRNQSTRNYNLEYKKNIGKWSWKK